MRLKIARTKFLNDRVAEHCRSGRAKFVEGGSRRHMENRSQMVFRLLNEDCEKRVDRATRKYERGALTKAQYKRVISMCKVPSYRTVQKYVNRRERLERDRARALEHKNRVAYACGNGVSMESGEIASCAGNDNGVYGRAGSDLVSSGFGWLPWLVKPEWSMLQSNMKWS